MVLQLSHKKKEMVVPVRKKNDMVTHNLRVQLMRGKLMKMLVRMWPGSIEKMQFLLASCIRVQ
jgi:hypothetical protein